MTSFKVELDDARTRMLRKKAEKLGLDPDQLILATLLDMLEQPETEFSAAMERVLKKNAELYRRLA